MSNCKKTNRLGLLFVLPVLCAAPSAAQEQDTAPAAQALLEQFDEMYRSTGGTAARIEIKIERPKKVRTMQMRSWSQGEDKALVVIDAPARDAGTATLRVGSNLWNYLPKISRTIRVPPALMMGAWMGSDLTNDDLVRESSYAHDYEITGVGPSEEPPGWQVNSEAKPGVPGLWERVEVVFAPPKLATDSTHTETVARTRALLRPQGTALAHDATRRNQKDGGPADPHPDCDLARARGGPAHGADLFTRGIRRRVGREPL